MFEKETFFIIVAVPLFHVEKVLLVPLKNAQRASADIQYTKAHEKVFFLFMIYSNKG